MKKRKYVIIFLLMIILILLPKYTLANTTIKLGDINGDNVINLEDALKLRKYIAYLKIATPNEEWNLSELQKKKADVNNDGQINIYDALKLRRYIATQKSTKIKKNHPDWTKLEEIEQPDIYDVILFWGQSNMVGRCTIGATEDRYVSSNSKSVKEYSSSSGISEDILMNNINAEGKSIRTYVKTEQTPNTVFEYMYSTNSLVKVTASKTEFGENLGYNSAGKLVKVSSGISLSQSNGTNMIPEFCKTYYQNTGHKVIVVFAALGGQPIDNFLPGRSKKIYEATKEKYEAAIKYLKNKNYNIGNQYYVVCQGETDVKNETTKQTYIQKYLTVHNNLKKLGIEKGALVETSRTPGDYTMDNISEVHDAQETLIKQYKDIILGSSFAYDTFVSTKADYNNCNTKITIGSDGKKLTYNEALRRALLSRDAPNNSIHFTSAGLAQIGREAANNFTKSLK